MEVMQMGLPPTSTGTGLLKAMPGGHVGPVKTVLPFGASMSRDMVLLSVPSSDSQLSRGQPPCHFRDHLAHELVLQIEELGEVTG